MTETVSTVLTVGHSTRSLDEFVHLLATHGATCVADVRTIPRSQRNPQFNRDTLPISLRSAGIDYVHLPGLGGLRRPQPDSRNLAWRNTSFRGFADYMQTPEFEESLHLLIGMAGSKRVALMCAEAVPWRCHRSLIADALLARGIAVEDIMTEQRRTLHAFPGFAKVHGTRVLYPVEEPAAGSALGTLKLTARPAKRRGSA